MSELVRIFDTTLRDGEQSAGVCFSKRDKLEIARQLETMRVDVIEAGFPASSSSEFEAVAQVAGAVRDSIVCALARAVPRDVDAAGEALHRAARPRIHVFLNASDIHLAHQLGKNRRQVVEMAESMVGLARAHTDDVEFSPMDATRADPAFVVEVVGAALAAGARTINVPDTVGAALPEDVAGLVRRLFTELPQLAEAVVSFHGQDDLGLATANALAALKSGARQLEVAVNGIGERAGNTSFEEVAAAIHVHGERMGVHTDVDLSGLCALSRLVAACSGIAVAPNKAVVGRNAFRHASGVHQDGVLKCPSTYELLDPALIGHPVGSEIVLGKLSGRTGFAERAATLGYRLRGAALQAAFERFQALAAGKAEVDDDDLREICATGNGAEGPGAGASRALGFALDL